MTSKKVYVKPETEVWRTCYESKLPKTHKQYVKYEVSNLGRVKRNGELHTPSKNNKGYYTIGCGQFVHIAIAKLFIPNPEGKPQVDHIDGDKTNNRYDNLRWVTGKENMQNPITLQKLSEKQQSEETRQKHSNSMKGKNKGRHRVYHSDGTYHMEK